MNPWLMLGLLLILAVIIWLFMAIWDDTIAPPRRRAEDQERSRFNSFYDGQDWRW